PFNPTTGQGGIRPIPGDIVQNQNTDGRTETGSLNIWLTPHGFLKAAAANGHATIYATRGKKNVVSYTALNNDTLTRTINVQHIVERVETKIEVGFTGDTVIEGSYSDYKEFAGVKFQMHIVQQQGGFPVLDITVAAVEPNSAAALEFRGNPQRGGAGG